MVYKTTFSSPFLEEIKASIMTKNNVLVSGIFVYQFNMYTMVSQIAREAIKRSDIIPVSVPVAIPETQNNTEDRGSMDSMVELKIP